MHRLIGRSTMKMKPLSLNHKEYFRQCLRNRGDWLMKELPAYRFSLDNQALKD